MATNQTGMIAMIEDDDIFDLIQTLNVEGLRALLDTTHHSTNYVALALRSTLTGPKTPLMAAIHRLRDAVNDGERTRASQIITLLINACRNLDPNQLLIPNDQGLTPLGAAILWEDEVLCGALLDAGVPLNAPCDRNYLPLEVAACEGRQRFVIAFIARNAPYSRNVLPPDRARDFARERRTMMVILYRALRLAPEAARLITAIFMNDGDLIANLVPLPQARRPLSGHAWTYILYHALPEHDQVCALLIPYICRTYTVRDCLGIAIDKNAEATFTVSINSVISTLDLGMIDTYQLARFAIERGQVQRAIAVLRRYAEIVDAMHNEVGDTFPDGTVVSDETLTQVGVRDDIVFPFLNQDQTEEERGIIPNYFNFNQPEHEVLAVLLEEAIGQDSDDLLNAIIGTILDDDDDLDIAIASHAIGHLLDNAVVDEDHATLRRLLRVPLLPERLSQLLPDAFGNNDLETAILLLEAGADPTIDENGDIIDAEEDQTIPTLQALLPYTLLNQYLTDNTQTASLQRALVLLSYGVNTTFSLGGGNQITLIEMAISSNNLQVARVLAYLGMDPCPYFTSFLSITHPTDIQINALTTVLGGLNECWNEIHSYGFYACQLFVRAYMTPTGSQLIVTLRLLANCQYLGIDIRHNINLLADAIAAIDIHEVEPLQLQSLRALPEDRRTEENYQRLPFPWNATPARHIAFYIQRLYIGRNNMTSGGFRLSVIQVRTLQDLGQNNNDLLLMILRILNTRFG